MPHPMNDVIVIVPGIMGSTLHRNDTPVWAPTTGGIIEAIRTGFRSIKTLRLPDRIGDDHPDDGVAPIELMPDIRMPFGLWTFDLGYSALIDFVTRTFAVNTDARHGPRNLITFPYDWRLSSRYNGQQLGTVAETALEQWQAQGGDHTEAKLVFICHSMGGLVARWYIDHLGGASNTRTLITLGTPHRGALNALDQLVNGINKGIGPFRLALTNLGRSLPSLHQLLPEYACIEDGPNLLKTTETELPSLQTAMVQDAMDFHTQLDAGRAATKGTYELHPLGGYEQPTLTTARIDGQRAITLRPINNNDEHGDATVPRLSFAPSDINPASASLHYAADNHAGLVHNQAIYDQIEGILTANPIVHRAGLLRIAADVPEVLDPGDPLTITADITNGQAPLETVVHDEQGKQLGPPTRLLPADGTLRAQPSLSGPGTYRVTIRGTGPTGSQVNPITALVTAWPDETHFDTP